MPGAPIAASVKTKKGSLSTLSVRRLDMGQQMFQESYMDVDELPKIDAGLVGKHSPILRGGLDWNHAPLAGGGLWESA